MGNTIVVSIALPLAFGTLTLMDDTGSNNYVRRGLGPFNSGGIFVYVVEKSLGPSSQLTVVLDAGASVANITVTEYENIISLDPTAVVTGPVGASNMGTSVSATASTQVSCQNSLLLVFQTTLGTLTSLDPSFTFRSSCNANYILDKVSTATASVDYTIQGTVAIAGVIIPFCIDPTSPSIITSTITSGTQLVIPAGGLLLQNAIFEQSTTLVVSAGSFLTANGTVVVSGTNVVIKGVNKTGDVVVIVSRSLSGTFGAVTAQSDCGKKNKLIFKVFEFLICLFFRCCYC
jgi:hypothetical protein